MESANIPDRCIYLILSFKKMNFRYPHQSNCQPAASLIKDFSLPFDFAAVLAGHIHRNQILTKDLMGRSISTPVFYPGSIERTSFAEKDEKKGYIIIDVVSNSQNTLSVHSEKFVELPARPMVKVNISTQGMDDKKLHAYINKSLKSISPQSVVKLNIQGFIPEGCLPVLRASSLRALAPKEMNISVRFVQNS